MKCSLFHITFFVTERQKLVTYPAFHQTAERRYQSNKEGQLSSFVTLVIAGFNLISDIPLGENIPH